jgi:hypothetical protein
VSSLPLLLVFSSRPPLSAAGTLWQHTLAAHSGITLWQHTLSPQRPVSTLCARSPGLCSQQEPLGCAVAASTRECRGSWLPWKQQAVALSPSFCTTVPHIWKPTPTHSKPVLLVQVRRHPDLHTRHGQGLVEDGRAAAASAWRHGEVRVCKWTVLCVWRRSLVKGQPKHVRQNLVQQDCVPCGRL